MTRWANEHTYDSLIRAAAVRYGLAYAVVYGLLATESGFNVHAVKNESGGRKSIGLAQLLLGTARDMGFTGTEAELYDPATNITLGARYLAQQYARAGSVPGAYSAYNGGWNPSHAMGTIATQPLRVVVNSLPLTYRDVKVGEYGNQPAVDRFMANVRYFQGQPVTGSPGGAPSATAGHAGVGTLVLLALAGAVGVAVATGKF